MCVCVCTCVYEEALECRTWCLCKHDSVHFITICSSRCELDVSLHSTRASACMTWEGSAQVCTQVCPRPSVLFILYHWCLHSVSHTVGTQYVLAEVLKEGRKKYLPLCLYFQKDFFLRALKAHDL